MAEDGGGGNGVGGQPLEVKSPKPSRNRTEDSSHSLQLSDHQQELMRNAQELCEPPKNEEEEPLRILQASRNEPEEQCRSLQPLRRKSHELCIITCKGTLGDPAFNKSFRRILSGLNKLLNTGEERVRVRKVEPWNSVRVTFTIPGDAAQRLRALALGGDSALSRLGILSVQLDPDQVIPLRVGMAGPSGLQQQVMAVDSMALPPSSTLPGIAGTSMSSLPGSTSLSSLTSSNIMVSSSLPGPSVLGSTSIGPLPGSSTGPLSLPGPSTVPLMAGTSSGAMPGPPAGALLAGASIASLPGPPSGPLLTGTSATPLLPGPSTGAALSGTPGVLPSSSAGPLLSGASPSIAGPTSSLLPPPLAGPSGLPASVPVPPQPRPPPPKVFPFHSMNQAATVMRATEQPPQPNTRQVVSGYPPPPYPNKVEGQVVSPLLVNLLQDSPSTTSSIAQTLPPQAPTSNHQVRVKQEEGSAFVSVGSSSYGGGAFRRLPPPYPGRPKEEPPPPPGEPPPLPQEEKKPETQNQETASKRQYLINPLTGVLEPMSSEDEEEEKTEPIIDDETPSEKNNEVHTVASAVPPTSVPPPLPTPPETPSDLPHQPKEEKIKLRLKLDKEAVGTVVSENQSTTPSPLQQTHSSPGYKVEMYVKRSHESSHISGSGGIVSNQVMQNTPQLNSTVNNSGIEEPRVPPLHISLRGRNAAVVVAPKKDKKRDTKKARKVSGELKRTKSSKLVSQPIPVSISPERSPERQEAARSPSPVSPRGDPELSGDIVPVRNYPSEAEVASILRSVVPHTTHKLLDESRLKRRESKKKMYPRLEYTGSKKGTKKGSGSLLKSVVKTNSKEVRMMSAVNKAIHRRDSADSTVANSTVFNSAALKQRSNSVPGTTEEFRPKVNCVFGKTTEGEGSKVVVNMCVGTGESPSAEPPPATAPGQKNQPDPAKRNNEGDDSGIESMDALSEKSPNQGESPQRTTGSSVGCKSVGVACGESPKPDQTQPSQLSTKDDQLSASGGGESPVPVRLTPALYTYSNPEKLDRRTGVESLSPSSVSGDEDDHISHSKPHPSTDGEEDYGNGNGRRSNSKSLLEQLLIEIPGENSSCSGGTGSGGSETTEVPPIGGSSNGSSTNTRRSRASRHKTWDSSWQTNHIDSRQSTLRVSKRKCSESAGDSKQDELGSPVSHDKTKPNQTRNSSTPGDELSEEEGSSIASGDVASNRSSVSPAPPLHSPRLRHKSDLPESPQQDKNSNGSSGNASNLRREVSVVLTKISRRVSVRQQKTGTGQKTVTEPSSPPVSVSKETAASASHRRKTRSQASDSSTEEGGSGVKRRRMSKDMK